MSAIPATTMHTCIVNVGHYRSGSTTLAKAAQTLGLRVFRQFPDLTPKTLKDILTNTSAAVSEWFLEDGVEEFVSLAKNNDLVCDGWVALLPFLSDDKLRILRDAALESRTELIFVATSRDIDETVVSELQHWVRHDLEEKADLDWMEKRGLEDFLRDRAGKHKTRIDQLNAHGFSIRDLPLDDYLRIGWPRTLAGVSTYTKTEWEEALESAGKCNANPPLPVEGILITLRLGNEKEKDCKIGSICTLLNHLEEDRICRYCLVLALDHDEYETDSARNLAKILEKRRKNSTQMIEFCIIKNDEISPNEPFPICSIWNEMAKEAWTRGADWVVLLGDDVKIECPFHFRATYRAFLDIAEKNSTGFGFGCPWWNDRSFPGFPSFPCVGKKHFEIFGQLIPEHRVGRFVNQDLDPYLHHLYLKFQASPCMSDAVLFNQVGGHIGAGGARYERVPAKGWRDFFLEDLEPIRSILPTDYEESIILDIIVPSYRVQLEYLRSITSLKVPERVCATFIIIIDNPEALISVAADMSMKKSQMSQKDEKQLTLDLAENLLEQYLSEDKRIVRVRCNKVNVGASASRNRGLDESAAEFVLHLDDDLFPDEDLLEKYCNKLFQIDDSVVGLVGLVRFPRDANLPLKHAAVLMSYLTFMFEIAERDMYEHPAWGVTANILFRRTHVRFDLAYAKTGGGEDVDYSLNVIKACNGGKLLAVPEARVEHPFWPGSVFTLAKHFYSWAIGDGALFKRFPEHCYWSFPNAPETLLFAFPCFWTNPWKILRIVMLFLLADFVVDASNPSEYAHRCQLLQQNGSRDKNCRIPERSRIFYVLSHMLANIYVVVLECGRLRGHIGRLEIFHGLFRRFDWHIGRLPKASENFRKRECWKFAIFVAIVSFELSYVPVRN